MGQIPTIIGKCRMCGIGVVVKYIGKNGILCLKCKKLVEEHKMELKKPILKTQQVFIPTDKAVMVVKDPMGISEGGFFPGQKFRGIDVEFMLQHCSFTEGTIIKMDGRNYIINTMETTDGELRQVPVPYKGHL